MIDSIKGLAGGLGPLSSTGSLGGVQAPTGAQQGNGAQKASFSDVFDDVLKGASEASSKADQLQARLQMDDPTVSLEQTVVAMNVSSLQFTGILQARNRVMQAYNEIMNMPV